jgi:hypothetical protein
VFINAWMYLGLFWMRRRPWAKGMAIALAVSNLVWLISAWLRTTGRMETFAAVLGSWFLIAIAMAGTHLLRLVIAGGHPVIGIARTVVFQAARMHLVTIVAVIVALILMFLPGCTDENERLNYRITAYIAGASQWSMTAVALLTCLLACWTVCYDQSRSQMYMVATKPVSTLAYLGGKTLGMAALVTVMVGLMGVGVWAGARAMGSKPSNVEDPSAMQDYFAAHHEVLTARLTSYPTPPDEAQTMTYIEHRFKELQQLHPQTFPEHFEDLDEKTRSEIKGHALAQWHTVQPGAAQRYLFKGLETIRQEFDRDFQEMEELKAQYLELKKAGNEEEADKRLRRARQLQQNPSLLWLRFKAKYLTPPKDELMRLVVSANGVPLRLTDSPRVVVMPNGAQEQVYEYPQNTVREVIIPRNLINERGELLITIGNPPLVFPDGSTVSAVSFAPRKDLELVVTYGTFEENILRGMFVQWVQLIFLAAAGIAAGTLLGFPMASVWTLMIYGVASLNASLAKAVDFYGGIDTKNKTKWDMILEVFATIWKNLTEGDLGGFFQLCIKLVGELALALMPSFSSVSEIDQIANGRLVTWALMWDTLSRLGLWSAAFIFIGWLILRRLEPARVTV